MYTLLGIDRFIYLPTKVQRRTSYLQIVGETAPRSLIDIEFNAYPNNFSEIRTFSVGDINLTE